MATKSKQRGTAREHDCFDFLSDTEIMNCLLKQKSRSHAFNKGGLAFLSGKSISDCPYPQGIYCDSWLLGYFLEQDGLPF